MLTGSITSLLHPQSIQQA